MSLHFKGLKGEKRYGTALLGCLLLLLVGLWPSEWAPVDVKFFL